MEPVTLNIARAARGAMKPPWICAAPVLRRGRLLDLRADFAFSIAQRMFYSFC